MLVAFDSQFFSTIIEKIDQKSNKLSGAFIGGSSLKNFTKQNMDFNKRFLKSEPELMEKKLIKFFPLSTENFRIILNSQIKKFQEIILPGSLIGCFSNFRFNQMLTSFNMLEIGPGKELSSLEYIRSYSLDGVLIQEWNNQLLQSLINIQQRFYFLMTDDSQLEIFLQFWSKNLPEKSRTSSESSRQLKSLIINIFRTQNQKFIVAFQMLFIQQQEKFQFPPLLTNQLKYVPKQCLLSDFKFDKTSQTSGEQQNKPNFPQNQNKKRSSQVKSIIQVISHEKPRDIMKVSLFSGTQNDHDLKQDISSNSNDFSFENFDQSSQNSQYMWNLHKRNIYQGIDGQDTRQIVLGVNELPKKYAKSVCSFQELKKMKKELQQDPFEECQKLSGF